MPDKISSDPASINNNKIFFINFFAGGISGIISKTIMAPVERVKLLMQTSSVNK